MIRKKTEEQTEVGQESEPISRDLAQRWLNHYIDAAQRTPSVREGARGAIAALKMLMRGEEPPVYERKGSA